MPELSSAIMKGVVRDLKPDVAINKQQAHAGEQVNLNNVEALVLTKDNNLVFGNVLKFDQNANVWLTQPKAVDSSGSQHQFTVKLNGKNVEVKSVLFHNSFIKSIYVVSGQIETVPSNGSPTYEVINDSSRSETKQTKPTLKKSYEIE